ncbi:MAG TPA: thiamine-binding protein, partial [Vicinamibacteria bacterium]
MSPLDTDRAASLADEGGASAAATETQERHQTDGASMLFELSILPLGEVHMSDEIAEVLEVVERSGLPFKLGPGSTYIEGTWDEVVPVIRACHACARRASRHVITTVRIEDDEGQPDKIRSNVESVEAKA